MSAANSAVILKGIANNFRIRCIYFLYRLILWLAAPALPFYFALRIKRDRRYARRFGERLGYLPFTVHPTPAGAIWLHAVSVGEVLSSISLVDELRRAYPLAPIYVSCTTVAGRELAETKLRGRVAEVFYAPLDFAWIVRRVLHCIRPALVVILETEIWPNLWREARRSGASLAIVNGRISDRALPRYRSLKWFFSAPLSQPDAIFVQSEQDRARYIEAGAPPSIVSVGGNLKYDFTPASTAPAPVADLIERSRPGHVWIAASTMPPYEASDIDEDDAVIAAFEELSARRRGLLLIHVPRRPERFDVAAAKLQIAGIPFVRRTAIQPGQTVPLPGVLLLDTIGELSGLFSSADAVFMGGTLARRGGHNILEPAFFGCAVVVGPHMENFAAIAAEFEQAGALSRIQSAGDLAPALEQLLSDAALRKEVGMRAREIASAKRGVTARIAEELLKHYDRGLPQRRGSRLLAPLAALWRLGVKRDRARCRPVALARPVISVGNITAGGSGKTPLVQWLSNRLSNGGPPPAILTRGYRRRAVEDRVVIPAGVQCPVGHTGDEAQIYVRQGLAHIGIGADRLSNAALIENELSPSAFLLDDGFQHWKLQRDLDIVLIDALDPFGGGTLLPRGRLREPLQGLARAGAIVITRCMPGLRTEFIERVIREHNSHAPIFRSYVRPREWVNARTGDRLPIDPSPFKRAAAFCGIGNPAGFWRAVQDCGVEIHFRWAFGDHHRYRPVQLKRLVEGAIHARVDALVTTEKDVINFPSDLRRIPESMPIYWLAIELEIDDADGLLAIVRRVRNRVP